MRAGLFLAAFALALAALAPGVALEDTGELSACALTLSLSHPPGHPWHALLGRLWLLLPVGSPDFRLNLMAACGGALGAVAAAELATLVIPSMAAPWMAGLAYATGLAAWRQAAAGEKYALAAAVFGWSLVALAGFARSGRPRTLLVSTLLFGLTFGFHLLGLYLAPVLAWGIVRARRVRAAGLAVMFAALGLSVLAIYPAVRAAAHPAINWDDPVRAPRLYQYLAAKRYAARFTPGATPVADALAGAVRRAAGMPWRAQGPVAALTVLGAAVLWRRDRRMLGLLAAVCCANAAVNELFAAIYPNPDVDRFYLPAALALAALAGAGAGAMIRWRRWTAAACAALVVAQAAVVWPGARRDRDFAGLDHERNLLMAVPPRSLLVGWGDLWMFPVWHAQLVMDDPRAARSVSAEALSFGITARRDLERVVGPGAAGLRGLQEGSPLVWRLAGLAAPAPVLLTDDPQFDLIPSRGIRWRGLLIRITRPADEPGVEDPALRWLRGLRLRSIIHPHDPFEATLTRYYAQSLHNTGRVALWAGQRATALRAALAGLRLDPASPQLKDLEWRAQTGARPAGGREAAGVLSAKGSELFQRNALPWAAFAWEEALQYDPAWFDALENLGTLAAVEERFSDAIRWFTLALQHQPGNAEAKSNLAEAVRSRDAVQKIPALERAADLHPNDPAAQCDLGNAYWYAGRPKVSEARYRRALALAPGYPRALGNLGSTLVGQGRIKEAIAVYQAASAARPDDPEPLLNLAEVYRGLGDHTRSEVLARRVLLLRPSDLRATALLGK